MIHGFFFDLDGTLVDTHQANFEAYRKAIKEVSGIDITLAQFKEYIGYIAKVFLPKLVPGEGKEAYEHIAALKAEYYKDLTHMTKLNVELVSFMDLMRDSRMALVTTAKRRSAESILERHGLERRFEHIITQEDVINAKPAPDAYKLALKLTGLAPKEVIVFEDSDSGRVAAEAAGLSVIMINKFSI